MSERNPAWQKDAVEWYTDPAALDVFLAPDGPKGWQRIERGEEPERRPLPKTKVSNIHEGDLSQVLRERRLPTERMALFVGVERQFVRVSAPMSPLWFPPAVRRGGVSCS